MHKGTRPVAEWLKSELRRTGAPVVEIADYAGVSRATMFRILGGKSTPTRYTIARIVAAIHAYERVRYAVGPTLTYEERIDDIDYHADELEGRVDELEKLLDRRVDELKVWIDLARLREPRLAGSTTNGHAEAVTIR